MAKPPKKQRLSVYLEPDVMKALAAHAARRDQSLSLIAEAFVTALGRRLAHGPKLRQEISEDVAPAHDAD
jgi:hypothetical protein